MIKWFRNLFKRNVEVPTPIEGVSGTLPAFSTQPCMVIKIKGLSEYELSKLDEWFEHKVISYKGARDDTYGLYKGRGYSFHNWAIRNCPDGIDVSLKDFEEYMKSKCPDHRLINGTLYFMGIVHLLDGDVKSGFLMT